MKKANVHMSPPRFLTLAFIVLAGMGTLLLKLPFATTKPLAWVDALFTCISAFTVTGLGVVDTGTHFTLFGQLVILTLIQVGGLGMMTFAIIVFIMLGKKIGLHNRILLQQALNQLNIGGVIRLAKALLIFSLSVEFIAFVLLCLEWVPRYGWQKGTYFSFFHAISAYNNAGFSIWPDNLMRHVHSPLVNVIITTLIIIGGLGFTVLIDVWKKRNFKQLSLHSKLMLVSTLVINIVATVLILLLEYNGAAMSGLSFFDKTMSAYFQAVTTRTAGFNTLDIAKLSDSTILFMCVLMIIGAGSASTGGGIKLTTFLIMILGVMKFIREQQEISVFRKSIKDSTIIKALSITMVAVILIFAGIIALTITEKVPTPLIIFEVCSAFGTVGLTMGLTFNLTVMGKFIISFMMFAGKVGPLTLAFTISKSKPVKIKHPSEDILTG
ncbi:TrkH family potassium uptake protein [Ectobacillus sp. JY-23]|uniref:TrkH family potassium uptake protein n=1 Tax=Ectobacillus sp. JY-23 TaxID=2933872 RepID=UPI001FF67021|nr:TrkH family potassium uptake protein [Ectobacillus sp. JY-23]UOY92630.1 TrkH family potassium uptake protein [Ectobacillus sp. JY-23]